MRALCAEERRANPLTLRRDAGRGGTGRARRPLQHRPDHGGAGGDRDGVRRAAGRAGVVGPDAARPLFRGLDARSRCLVPASGWYEWTAVPGGKGKQPWYSTDPEGDDLRGLAGLLDRWVDRDGTPRAACAIVTTAAATDDLRALHDRMPVVLPRTAEATWLDHVLWPGGDGRQGVAAPQLRRHFAEYPRRGRVVDARRQTGASRGETAQAARGRGHNTIAAGVVPGQHSRYATTRTRERANVRTPR